MLLQKLIDRAAQKGKKTVAVVSADDEEVIEAVLKAIDHKLAQFVLIGNEEQILRLLKERGAADRFSESIRVIHEDSKEQSAAAGVKSVKDNEADVLMKGNLPTSIFLKAILDKDYGLRSDSILSHVAVFEIPGYEQLKIITDAAFNIAPKLEQKAQIIKNAVNIAKSIGIDMPKVAAIAAVEVVNPGMQATIDAAGLTLMNRRGQITGCIIDGPLGLDNAISSFAAEQKGIQSDVAGCADILMVPGIEAGNVLYKSLIYFARARVAGVIAGARAPIVLTSRSDRAENKFFSLALAICSAGS